MTDAEQTREFCSVLLGDLVTDDGHPMFTTVWASGPDASDKVTRWLPVGDTDGIVTAVRELDALPGYNTYLAMGVARERFGANRRMRASNVYGLTSVWAEVDIADDAHTAANLPPDERTARAVLESTGLAPSLLWHSGHGLQAAWLLDEPWVWTPGPEGDAERDEAATLLREWRGSLAVRAHRIGAYKIDSVFDLSRVLRAPGTTNRKIIERKVDGEVVERVALPHTPCVLREADATRRYSIDDLRAHLVDAKYLEAFAGLNTADNGEGAGKVDLKAAWTLARSYAPDYQPPWLEAVLYDAPQRFRDVWAQGHESGDDSSTDASIARHLANIGGDEALAVEAIMCYRLRTGRRVDKVDPSSRTDYIVRTVNAAFNSKRAADAKQAAAENDAAEALAAIEAEAERRRTGGPVADDAAIVDRPDGPPQLAEMAVHVLTQTADIIVPDGTVAAADAPSAATPADPVVDGPDVVVDEAYDPQAAAEAERVLADQIPVRPGAEIPGAPPPRRLDVVASLREAEGEDADGTGPSLVPPANPWGTRTESQTRELDALSEMLLPSGQRVWRLLERGRGAKMERRLQIRLPVDHVFITTPPVGYRPGYPLHTGWWPAASFNAVGGFIAALRQDAKLTTRPVAAQEFNTRFADTLVALWEADEASGSIANVAVAAIAGYLTEHSPVISWVESSAAGTPYIQFGGSARWDPTGTFQVWVRWSELLRYVRAHHAQNVTPQVSAELMEVSHSVPAPSMGQPGQWYVIDRSFLPDWRWQAVMDAARLAEQRRSERRGMHVVDTNRDAR